MATSASENNTTHRKWAWFAEDAVVVVGIDIVGSLVHSGDFYVCVSVCAFCSVCVSAFCL